MPAPIQALTYAVPARYFLVIVPRHHPEGRGPGAYWRDVAFLVLYASVVPHHGLCHAPAPAGGLTWAALLPDDRQGSSCSSGGPKKIIPALIIGLSPSSSLSATRRTSMSRMCPLLLVDRDHSVVASRALIERFDASGYFEIKGRSKPPTRPSRGSSRAWPRWSSSSPKATVTTSPPIALRASRSLADGTDANSAVVGLGYASRIIAEMGGTLQQTRPRPRTAAAWKRRGGPGRRPPGLPWWGGSN